MRIVCKARKTLFPAPSDSPDSDELNGTILVSPQKLQAVEEQFMEWAQSLTEILSYPSDDIEVQRYVSKDHSPPKLTFSSIKYDQRQYNNRW